MTEKCIQCQICNKEFTYVETWESYGMTTETEYHLREIRCPNPDCNSFIIIRMEPNWAEIGSSQIMSNNQSKSTHEESQ